MKDYNISVVFITLAAVITRFFQLLSADKISDR